MCPGPWMVDMSGTKVKPLRQRPRNTAAVINTSAYNTSNTFLNDIRSIIFVLNLTGLLPVYQRISKYELGSPTRAKRIYWIFAHVIIHFMTICNLYILVMNDTLGIFSSYVEEDNITLRIEVILCSITYTTTVFMCFKYNKIFLTIFNDTLKVDDEIDRKFSANIANNCGFANKFLILIVLSDFYIIILSALYVEAPITVNFFINVGLYALQNGLWSIFIIYASILLRVVTVRFAYINAIIGGYTYRQQEVTKRQTNRGLNNIFSSGTFFSQPPTMQNFPHDSLFAFRMYNKLLRVYKAINECCSLILVVYMGFAFYSITTTTYNLFIQITTQRDLSLLRMQLCFAYLINPTAMLALLSRCAGQATNQANETSQILARVYDKSKDCQNIIDKFLTKSIKQEVHFSAYGFFVIDNSTLFKIFSAVTTYLVILIQFKQLEESRMEDIIPTTTTKTN